MPHVCKGGRVLMLARGEGIGTASAVTKKLPKKVLSAAAAHNNVRNSVSQLRDMVPSKGHAVDGA